jgi:FkbM family methyltransferase
MNEITAMNIVAQSFNKVAEQLIALQKDMVNLQKAMESSGEFRGDSSQKYGYITYAQHGEDLLFANYFEMLGIKEPTWLDIGAHHPLIISNTALLSKLGGHGVNVEANPNLMEYFRRMRPRDVNVNVGVAPKDQAGRKLTFYMIDKFSGRNTFDRKAAEEFVALNPAFSIQEEMSIDVISIDEVVKCYCGGTYPDLLSIDIENLDYDVLASADFSKSRPKLICVEVLSAGGDASDKMKKLLVGQGFVVLVRTIGNYIFADQSLKDRLC